MGLEVFVDVFCIQVGVTLYDWHMLLHILILFCSSFLQHVLVSIVHKYIALISSLHEEPVVLYVHQPPIKYQATYE